MEAKELMIGDWVLDGMKVAQVTSITCDGIIETTLKENSNIELISPIPLTKEILKKNGFKFKELYKNTFELKFINIIPRVQNETNGVCCIEDIIEITIFIKYVHELQNTIRLCRINKEIEL